MFTAIAETANTISPFTTAVSNGILKSISTLISVLEKLTEPSLDKKIVNATKDMKCEYPYESIEYVHYLVRTQMFGEKE